MERCSEETSVEEVADECLALAFSRLHCKEDRDAVALTCRRWRALEALSRHSLLFTQHQVGLPDEATHLQDLLLHALRRFPEILHISIFRYTKLSDAFFTAFQHKGFSQLKVLHLHYCFSITDKSLACFAHGCPSLTHLTLTMCELVTDVGLHSLAGCTGLEFLDVSHCKPITDAGIDGVLAGCQNMEKLVFSYCSQIEGWGLRNGKRLRKVQAEACKLSDSGLIEGLQGATSLEILDMGDTRSGVRLGPPGLAKIGENCKLLEVLCLRMCRILDDSSVQKIAQGCPQLRVCDMALCQEVTFQGWQALALFSTKLQNLAVNRCRQFCDCSLLAIQDGCPSLCCLYIHGCSSLSHAAFRLFQVSRPAIQIDILGVLNAMKME